MPKEHLKGEPLKCKWCKLPILVSKLYPLVLKDWEGMLPAVCFGCAKVHEPSLGEYLHSEAMFEKAADKRWKMKTSNHRQTARIKGVQEAMAKIDREPDENRRTWLRRVFKASIQMAANIFAQFEKYNPQQKKDLKETLQQFKETCDKQAEDPGFVPRLNVGCILPSSASQYTSMITETMAEYFLCRVSGTCLTLHSVAFGSSHALCGVFFPICVGRSSHNALVASA